MYIQTEIFYVFFFGLRKFACTVVVYLYIRKMKKGRIIELNIGRNGDSLILGLSNCGGETV